MIVVTLVFLGTFVVLPAGLSFVSDGDLGAQAKKQTPIEQVVVEEYIPDPDPVFVARLKAKKKTVITLVPVCSDEGSEGRLRTASLDFLEQIEGLPEETVFEIQDCGDEGMVDIQIIETIEKDPSKP